MKPFIHLNILAVGLFTCAFFSTQLSAATVGDILGARNALQCYSIDSQIRCRDLLTGEDWNVMGRAKAAKQQWGGSINAGGTKLVLEDDRWVCVVNLDGSNKQYVAGPRMTNGHFFRDTLGNDWVVYTGEEESYRQAGTTWMVRIDAANKAIDSTRTLLVGEQYTCGLSGSGAYLGDVYANAFLYNLNTKKKSPVLYDTTSWWEPECFYGSTHPGAQPWLMFSIDSALHTIVIAQWNETTNQHRFIWQYSHPTGTAYALWSSTDAGIASIVKDGQLYIAAITPDTSGSAGTTGSYTEAATGLAYASDSGSAGFHIVGRPWVGTRNAIAGTPIIAPAGGAYAEDTLSVSIASITDSASIYYTTDGSAPTESSTVYSAPFQLPVPATGSVTITARAFKIGMTESPVAAERYSRITLNEATTLSAEMESGLNYDYYEGFFLSPTDINETWAQPTVAGAADSFHIAMRESEEQFAIRFSGYFKAPADGKYTFHLTSDDSSRLVIDSALVVATNYKLAVRTGSIGLKAGMHPLELLYQQGDGGKKLFVDVEGPQISKTIVTSAMLFRKKQLITVTAPAAFDTVLANSALAVKWTADASVTSVFIDVSTDKRLSWTPLTAAAVARTDTQWGNYAWTVPDYQSAPRYHNARINIRVRSAADSSIADCADHTVFIKDPSSIRIDSQSAKRLFAVRNTAAALEIDIPFHQWHRLTLTALNGRIIARHEAMRAKTYRIKTKHCPAGLYLLNVQTGQAEINRPVVLIR